MLAVRQLSLLQRTVQVSKYNVVVAESTSKADTGDLCGLFVRQWENILTDTERRAGLSTIAEPLVLLFPGRCQLGGRAIFTVFTEATNEYTDGICRHRLSPYSAYYH